MSDQSAGLPNRILGLIKFTLQIIDLLKLHRLIVEQPEVDLAMLELENQLLRRQPLDSHLSQTEWKSSAMVRTGWRPLLLYEHMSSAH
eukprot:640810-Amphidinium_carterae.1